MLYKINNGDFVKKSWFVEQNWLFFKAKSIKIGGQTKTSLAAKVASFKDVFCPVV
jgi:hypothetical protein